MTSRSSSHSSSPVIDGYHPDNALNLFVCHTKLKSFLGPRGPLVLPLVECPPARAKNLDHNIYRHTCLMNHQKSHQTNPMAQRDPIDAPLTPWDPVGLPLDPLGPCRPTP